MKMPGEMEEKQYFQTFPAYFHSAPNQRGKKKEEEFYGILLSELRQAM